MKIHEYQAKELLAEYGVITQKGYCVENDAEALTMAKRLCDEGAKQIVVKAQIHSGGRGKGGGVKLAKSLDEAVEKAKNMLGMNLVTHQTGAEGKTVNKVLLCEAADIAQEYYVSIILDGTFGCPLIVASSEGGTEIEKTAEVNPDAIITKPISPLTGLKDFHAKYVALKMNLDPSLHKSFIETLKNMYRLFIEKDCSLVEINPLSLTEQGQLLAVDAKINFDENALFRHPEILAFRDILEEDPKELEAAEKGFSYVALYGNIGCMVNGAGLAMATMDIIKEYGGSPANFLDVGGSASVEKVSSAFRILLSDKNIKAVLVNIFGGIMKCDVIAEGIIGAAKEVKPNIPLVVRLDGTRAKEGRELLASSGLSIISADSLSDAVKIAVEKSILN
ncbi:MAG: ADP-forming succinate--CoA ligase subunit beta [Firmicutes bacterium]|nr:ADP-forming succinate--CoA ligase subunit beta [Bacillota bacterium]MCL2256221.1 ADP-forming succinate--CoA ligase subunit beta [Bacillota bacterium]